MTKIGGLGRIGNRLLTWVTHTVWESERLGPDGGRGTEVPSGIVLATSKGLVRPNNEDRCLVARSITQGWVCCVLCDGIGGLSSGERAAEIAVCRFLEHVIEDGTPDVSARLIHAAEAANAEVYRHYSEKAGTTLAAVFVDRNNSFFGVTAGDSRIYTLHEQNRLEQISTDDTIAGELQRIRGGSLQPEEVDPSARQLAQFVGMGPGIQPRIYEAMSPSQGGWIMMTTDGVHSIPQKLLERLAIHASSPYSLSQRLIALARWLGGFDNASLVLIPCVLRSPSLEEERAVAEGLEFWNPFSGKLHLDSWSDSPSASTAQDGALSDQEGPPERNQPKPQAGKQAPTPLLRRPPERRRPLNKREEHKRLPQLGMELIENASLHTVLDDSQHSLSKASTSDDEAGE